MPNAPWLPCSCAVATWMRSCKPHSRSSTRSPIRRTAFFNRNKDLPGAEAALRKAIQLNKNNTDALEKLGKVQVQEGSADQALALYLQSIKDNPRDVTFYILSGELYEAKKDWDHAKG